MNHDEDGDDYDSEGDHEMTQAQWSSESNHSDGGGNRTASGSPARPQ